MSIMMVLAIGENGEVGQGNEMPWGLEQKSDLAHFRNLTQGGVVIMGRHTHESILDALGTPLPKRVSVVVSKKFGSIEGVMTTSSIKDACEIANKQNGPVFVIGGASVFEQAIDQVDQIYLTVIEKTFEDADKHFDKELLSGFTLSDSMSFDADERNAHPYRFEVWRRMD